jgi:peptidoglycan/LPS O-acetylase OafA/YrhL
MSAAPATALRRDLSQSRLQTIPELDGIRGIAVTLVLLVHFSKMFAGGSSWGYAIVKTCAPCWVGVNLFFVLSGFLITGILLDTRAANNFFRAFYARRFLRIFPLYYAFLSVALPISLMASGTNLRDAISYVLYSYNWNAAAGHGIEALGHLWSLAIEEQFYLFWPLLVFLTPRKRVAWLCVAMIAVSIGSRLLFVQHGLSRYAYFATISHFEELCYGALAAVLIRDFVEAPWMRITRAGMIAGTVLASIALLLSRGFESNKPLVLTLGQSGVALLFVAFVGRAYVQSGLGESRYLRARWLIWMGKYSYGIYVLHVPVAVYLTRQVSAQPMAIKGAAAIAGAAVSCFAAWISYEHFEKRLLRRKPAYRFG